MRSPALLSGYLIDGRVCPALTADGFFRTGDLGELDAQGRVHVHGRADRTIITGGEKVAPSKVESALLDLPEVEAAFVFGVDDPEWGQRVAAAIVPRTPTLTPTLTPTPTRTPTPTPTLTPTPTPTRTPTPTPTPTLNANANAQRLPLTATSLPTLSPHERPRLIALLPSLPTLPSGKPDRAAITALALPRLRPPIASG